MVSPDLRILPGFYVQPFKGFAFCGMRNGDAAAERASESLS